MQCLKTAEPSSTRPSDRMQSQTTTPPPRVLSAKTITGAIITLSLPPFFSMPFENHLPQPLLHLTLSTRAHASGCTPYLEVAPPLPHLLPTPSITISLFPTCFLLRASACTGGGQKCRTAVRREATSPTVVAACPKVDCRGGFAGLSIQCSTVPMDGMLVSFLFFIGRSESGTVPPCAHSSVVQTPSADLSMNLHTLYLLSGPTLEASNA